MSITNCKNNENRIDEKERNKNNKIYKFENVE